MSSDENAAKEVDPGRIVNGLNALIWTTRSDGRCDFVNRHWCDYTGLAFEASQGHGWQSAIHPDDMTSFLDQWRAIKQSGIAQDIDARLRRFDGEYRWFVLQPSFTEEVDGDPRWCWLGLHADESTVTDGRLRRLFNMLPWQAGFLNTAGVLEFTNEQSLKDFNMTARELEQWTQSGIIHADDHDDTIRHTQALLTTGQMMDHRFRMLYPDGTYRWTHSRCVPVRDGQGNVVRYVTFQVDVDDLKRAEELLAAEVEMLERLGRGEPLGEVLVALSHHVEELCNGGACHILLVSSDGRHFEVGAGSRLPNAFNEFVKHMSIDRSGRDPYSTAFMAKAPVIIDELSADSRWEESDWFAMMTTHGYASCCCVPILSGSGETCGIIALYRGERLNPAARERDLLDRFGKIAGIAINRARADEALNQVRLELTHVARTATLSTMTASLTHEVSQPLSGILTNANTCARMLAADPPNLVGAIETVRRTIRDANRATEVIRRLRAMFAKKAPTLEIVDLNEATQEVIAMSSAELRRGRAIVETDLAEMLPVIRGDRVQLQQVILNLLLNAADAMADVDDRPRTLRVQTRAHDGDYIQLLVRDSGIGLDPQVMDKLFEAFYTTKIHGLGIGLAISRSIIESHKGKLWAKPNDGPGATFGFCIPCASDAGCDQAAVA